MTVQLLVGDCLETLKTLPDASVQCCVTSPPYYGLRDYGVDGQIGLEETPEAYVAKLVAVFREVKRVLKDDGTFWLNLGDSFAGSGKGQGGKGTTSTKQLANYGSYHGNIKIDYGDCKSKDLIGIPWMVAFALRADGWWLRSDIIWAKPNPMPESVTDRPTKSHEYIFLLTKSARYYYDAEAIKEPNADPDRTNYKPGTRAYAEGNTEQCNDTRTRRNDGFEAYANGKTCNGRNKRDVWTVTTKPYREAHFATFPPDLIEPCILAGTSEKGECPVCGKAWKRVVEKNTRFEGGSGKAGTQPEDIHGKWEGKQYGKNILLGPVVSSETTGWQPQCECMCPAPEGSRVLVIPDLIPQTILDPFSGAGTTGVVAVKHSRNYIGCELNPTYIEMTNRRLAKVQPILL